MKPVVLPREELRFARGSLQDEYERADYRLQILIAVACHVADRLGYSLVWTSLEREPGSTSGIYARNGQPVPYRGNSVHEVVPCRGADAVLQPGPEGNMVTSEESAGQLVADRINEMVKYPREKKAALWHRVQGPKHLHLQVPWDGLEFWPASYSRA